MLRLQECGNTQEMIRQPQDLGDSIDSLSDSLDFMSAVIARRTAEQKFDDATLSKVQSVDQRMRLGMPCRFSPTVDVPSHTSKGGYVPDRLVRTAHRAIRATPLSEDPQYTAFLLIVRPGRSAPIL